MAKIGIIGMGNMGYAILKGLLKVYGPQELLFTDVNETQCRRVTEETHVPAAPDNASCARQASYIVLAVKPRYYASVLEDIKDAAGESDIIISIAPGITTGYLKEMLEGRGRIVRAMPNTPALLGEGMTGVCMESEAFTEEERREIEVFFQSFGRMQVVEEQLMDAVVCVSGSSPAYVYMMIEALADSAVKYGLPRQAAYRMAAQTVAGSARMVLETGEHPGTLKDKVCSPGGTTIAAVEALEEWGFRNAIMKASDACYSVCVRNQ